jgi:putative aldouronate transport system substrate-binding protein
LENGYIVDKDTEDDNLALNYKGLNQLLAFLPSAEETDALIPIEKDKYAQAQADAYAAALDYAEINPALSYLVNSATYSASGADLDTQVTSLRTQYICGEITLDKFKSSLDSIRSQGYDDIIKEVNEQYTANK